MSEDIHEFEGETSEGVNPCDDLWPEDRENLEKAINECAQIFKEPAQADPEKAFEAIEILEEVQPHIDNAQISDRIGEMIELLQEICDGALSSADAKEGKRIAEKLAETLKIDLPGLD